MTKNVAHIYLGNQYDGYLLNVRDEDEVRTWLFNHYRIKELNDPSVKVVIENWENARSKWPPTKQKPRMI